MHFKLKELFFLSFFEKGRVPEPAPDPRSIASFNELDAEISHSLKAPGLIRTQTQAGTLLKTPVAISRPFQDEALIQKLLSHRNQIPKSTRIIRAEES